MKASPILLLALAAALALAASAHAKGSTTVTVWGASGSANADAPARISRLPVARRSLAGPPRLAPFYTFEIRLGHDRPAQRVLALWVPSARRLAAAGVMGDLEWFRVGPLRARVLDAAVAGLRPYQPGPAWPPRLASVEQIASLAGAPVATARPPESSPPTDVLAALVAAGVSGVGAFLLWRRRVAARAVARVP